MASSPTAANSRSGSVANCDLPSGRGRAVEAMNKPDRDLRSVKVVQVIEATFPRGRGIEGDPVRIVTQFWSFDGELLAVNDPLDPPVVGREG